MIQISDGLDESSARAAIAPFVAGDPQLRGHELVVPLQDLDTTGDIVKSLAAAGATHDQIKITKPSMDDVFFELTGRPHASQIEKEGKVQ